MALLPTGSRSSRASGPDGPAGATANAVCSLSLEPMLMLACLDRGSRTLLAVQAANRFGINVLARRARSRSPAPSPPRPRWRRSGTGIDWSERDGIPAIDGALAWVACDLRDVIAGGDHVIVTGEVRRPGGAARATRSSSTAASTDRWILAADLLRGRLRWPLGWPRAVQTAQCCRRGSRA